MIKDVRINFINIPIKAVKPAHFYPPTEGKASVKMILQSTLHIISKLMRCGLSPARCGKIRSQLVGLVGPPQPSGLSRRQSVVDQHAAGAKARSRGA